MECGHHFLEAPLVVGHFIGGREAVADAQRFEMLFQLRHQDVPQGHRGRPDLRSHDLESARNAFRGVGDLGVSQTCRERSVFGERRHDRHEVRLAGAVVADNQKALVVGRKIELQLGNGQTHEPFCHLLRNDVGLDELPRRCLFARVTELSDGLYGFELDQVAVLHRGW